MKSYNIKGTATPTSAILAQVEILAQVKLNIGTGEARGHSLMAKLSYLVRPILAIPHQLSAQGSAVTQSWS